MTTTASFSTMLKEYMPYELLMEEMKRRNFFWNKVNKDSSWKGGTLYVPFEGAEYSSLSFGALTASNDIAEMAPVKGYVSTYPEIWGSMKFYEKDLDLHGDLKTSFLKILPGKIDQFVQRMTDRVSHSLLIGPEICKLTTNGDAGGTGIFTVDHPERLTIGEKVNIDDANSSAAAVYIKAIDMNTKSVTVSDTRGGSAFSVSGYTTAQSAALYTPGTDGATAGFTPLKGALLSQANGGTTNLYNVAKTAYPFLQSQNILGSGITAANVLEKFFDAMMEVLTLGKGNPSSIICSYKHFANCAKSAELNRQYNVSDRAAGYGFRKISVLGSEGEMEIIGLRDMDDDVAFIIDWKAVKFFGSHFFDRKRHLNNEEFFMERATTGYTYIVDIRFFGDLIVHNPSHCGIIYGISY